MATACDHQDTNTFSRLVYTEHLLLVIFSAESEVVWKMWQNTSSVFFN